MSIYRARLRNTSNALTLQMSSEQIRLQVSPKLFEVNSWIPQNRNEFQTLRPATENAQEPTLLRRTRGTDS